jgi:ABC-type phosphate/phosphonate transport system substrate-binding protein
LVRFASYPWYDGSETRAHVNQFWAALRTYFVAAGLQDVPTMLDRERPYGVDPNAECLFSQTCSYTLFTTAKNHFQVLGAPAYTARGCTGAMHSSFIVVRDTSYIERLEDLRNKTFAINEPNSNSGMNLPRYVFSRGHKSGQFFDKVVVSGSHRLSADLVSTGRADAAAIDCITFGLLERYRPPAIKRLRIIAETPDSRTPPFVTSRRTSAKDVAALRGALHAFFTDSAQAKVRDALMLGGIEFCDESAYAPVMKMEAEAIKYGYPELK